jgi:hypothetical protein
MLRPLVDASQKINQQLKITVSQQTMEGMKVCNGQ